MGLGRRIFFGTTAGSNELLGSLGELILTAPLTVVSVFGVVPLPELPERLLITSLCA